AKAESFLSSPQYSYEHKVSVASAVDSMVSPLERVNEAQVAKDKAKIAAKARAAQQEPATATRGQGPINGQAITEAAIATTGFGMAVLIANEASQAYIDGQSVPGFQGPNY